MDFNPESTSRSLDYNNKITQQHNYSMNVTPTDVVLMTINVLTSFIISLILMWSVYNIFFMNKDKVKEINKCSLWLTFSGILFHFTLGILDPLLFYFYEIQIDNETSLIIYHLWYCAFALCRLSIYLVYIYRLHTVFSDSVYSHSKCIYITIGIGCIISMCSIVVSLVMGNTFTLDGANNNEYLIILFMEISFLIMDVTLIISLIWLFLSPLLKLFRMLNETNTSTSHLSTQIEMSETKSLSNYPNRST
eukprot:281705_1